MMLEMGTSEKFFLEDESDGSIILISEIDIDPSLAKSNHLILRGNRFYVDYENNAIDEAKQKVEVLISFFIEGICEVE